MTMVYHITREGASRPILPRLRRVRAGPGIPGILAHMENGRLAEGAKVNRCDLCQRYPSDEAALEKLRQLDRA